MLTQYPKTFPLFLFSALSIAAQTVTVVNSDAGDEAARVALDSVRKMRIPSPSVEGRPMRTAQFLKLVKDADSKVALFRSVSAKAVALAAELAPDEFPH